MRPFETLLCPDDVGELIDLTVEGDTKATQSMADLQLEGIAALYNILCKHDFAYLADEVGMGKTYQALGLTAILWNEDPTARILFISPRQNLQAKWGSDYLRFYSSNYRRKQGFGDDRASSVLFRQPVHRPELFNNLRTWSASIGLPLQTAPFIRHTSFTRPVYVTSGDLKNVDALLIKTREVSHSCGLFNVKLPILSGLALNDASRKLNVAFANALNEKLEETANREPYFDLVIVDEAQCLRNPNNQTNEVLYRIFRNQVKKWLFMSATPAHGGPGDLPTILNHYPNRGQVLDPDLVKDLASMQTELQEFLVRRPRKYQVSSSKEYIKKNEYRRHDLENWAIDDESMNVLETLSIGLVQKGLTLELEGRSNRFRTGFLSSFESLQSSLIGRGAASLEDSELHEREKESDFQFTSSDRIRDAEAPDSMFVNRVTASFEEEFGIPLPHPKVDYVVNKVAESAFGNDEQSGGCKFLIFTRRISTVDALRTRLMAKYHQSVENRIRRCWGKQLNWKSQQNSEEALEFSNDDESIVAESSEDLFRHAMSQGQWLYRYRQTFRESGRNALFFEDAWFRRLCVAGGVDVTEAAEKLPADLWRESWTHAARSDDRGQFRARRVRYLSLHAIQQVPEIFGFDKESARPWRAVYESILHEHLRREIPANEPHLAVEMLTRSTLWAEWDKRFPVGPLALPANERKLVEGEIDSDEIYRRQVIRTLLGQTFRLTDTLLDLYFANEQSGANEITLPVRFLDWISSGDPSARQLRNECEDWIEHVRLIVDSCLDGAGKTWRELASTEEWPQLYNLSAVVGVVGGSGDQRSVTRQFRTPSLPRIVVCTDTLKEGVDLHLFCDHVIHYGVAWTSGDLEQRTGRIDRFFSQIERRLQSDGSPPEVALEIGYPHVVASLEKAQVERVRYRQKLAEKLMDHPIPLVIDNEEDHTINDRNRREPGLNLAPFGTKENQFPKRGRNVIVVSENNAGAIAEHYREWYAEYRRIAHDKDWQISPESDTPVRSTTLYKNNSQYDIDWGYDATIERYLITIADVIQCESGAQLASKRRRLKDKRYQVETFIRSLIPKPEEGVDETIIVNMLSFLDDQPLHANSAVERHWQDSLASIARTDESTFLQENEAVIQLPNRDREQAISLRVQNGFVQIYSLITPLRDLPPRIEWGDSNIPERIRSWTRDATNNLTLGFLTVNDVGELVYGINVICGDLSAESRKQVLFEAAWRADSWEAVLTGKDQW